MNNTTFTPKLDNYQATSLSPTKTTIRQQLEQDFIFQQQQQEQQKQQQEQSQSMHTEVTLETLLDDVKGKELFKKFFKKLNGNNPEALNFIEAVEEYQTLRSPFYRYRKLGAIIDQYIKTNAKNELTLCVNTKQALINRVKTQCSAQACPDDLFENCIETVVADLKRDIWPKFARSTEFHKYLKTRSEQQGGTCWAMGTDVTSVCGFDISTPFFTTQDFERVTEWALGNTIDNIPWKEVSSNKEYSVYLSQEGIKADEHSNRAVKSWKIKGTIQVPALILAQLLVSTNLRTQTDGNLRSVTALEYVTCPESDYACSITHEEYDMGSMVTDRDYVISQSFKSETYNGGNLKRYVLIRKTVEHNKAPKAQTRPIRAYAVACFLVEEINETSCRYYEVGWIDLQGSMPQFLWTAILKLRGKVFHKGLQKRYKMWTKAIRDGTLDEKGYTEDAGMLATLQYYEEREKIRKDAMNRCRSPIHLPPIQMLGVTNNENKKVQPVGRQPTNPSPHSPQDAGPTTFRTLTLPRRVEIPANKILH